MTGLSATWCVWVSSLVLLIATAFASPCVAQSDPRQTALARTLFEEGVAAADRGDWVGAAERFQRAYALKPTSGLAFNWASALIETNQLLAAQELLLNVRRDPSADAGLKRDSDALLQKVSPRIARLRVHVDQPDERTRVEVDRTPWPREAWDVASPIDPGAHTVVLKRGDDERAHTELTLKDGESRTLTLAPGMQEGAIEATAATSDQRERPPLYKNWIFWTAVGAVVVGGVVTAIVVTRDRSEPASPIAGNASPGVLRW